MLGIDCELFGLLIGCCNNTPAAPARKDRDGKRRFGSLRSIHSFRALSSEFHGCYAASSRLDLSRKETGVNQLALNIVETLG